MERRKTVMEVGKNTGFIGNLQPQYLAENRVIESGKWQVVNLKVESICIASYYVSGSMMNRFPDISVNP